MSGRDSPNGKLGLAQVILTSCQSIPKSLPDDVLKVQVHVGMRARSGAKEKPRRAPNRPGTHERKPPKTIVLDHVLLGKPDLR